MKKYTQKCGTHCVTRKVTQGCVPHFLSLFRMNRTKNCDWSILI